MFKKTLYIFLTVLFLSGCTNKEQTKPYSNTYLVIASCLQGMLDGILSIVKQKLDTTQLENEISKKIGEDAFSLDKNREYSTDTNVFEHYTEAERDTL